MDAVVTAGGIPLPEEPLYMYSQGNSKAMLDVAGKPMVQWVLDALNGARTIDNIVLVGLTEKSGLKSRKPIYFIPNQGKMLDNLHAGVQKVRQINKRAEYVLGVSSDIPAINSAMVDWVVNTAMQTRHDVYYNVITRQVMEKRFPSSRRTYVRLKDMELCGGDMNVARIALIGGETGIWAKLVNSRKSPLKQAALLGFDTLLLLVFHRITLEQTAERVSRRLNVNGRAIPCPYAEVGMDVDKPHQLEILRKHMLRMKKKGSTRKVAKKIAKPARKALKKPVKKAARKPPEKSAKKTAR